MKKTILTVIATVLLLLFHSGTSYAVDLTVDCPGGGNPCSKVGLDPLFSIATDYFWYPGKTVSKTVTVKNSSTSPQNFSMLITHTSEVDSVIENAFTTAVKQNVTTLFTGTLAEFYAVPAIDMGVISSGGSQDYSIAATLDPNAGNELENRQTAFDITIGFNTQQVEPSPSINPSGEPFTSPSPTPVSSPPENNGGGGGDNGGGGGGGGNGSSGAAPTCDAQAPTSAPSLSVSANGSNSVILSWSSVSPVTHYMIRYGTTPGSFIYGAANVGNVTTFTVNQLSAGQIYYFEVAGVNGCKPGPWSNQSSVSPSGAVLALGPAAGFTEQVLGATTASPEPSATPETLGTPSGEVKGETTCIGNPWWWIPLLIEAAILLIYIFINPNRPKYWWLIPVVLAIASQIVHYFWGCRCLGRLCNWYWLFNLIIAVIAAINLYQKDTTNN
jgi:hypothetical protein